MNIITRVILLSGGKTEKQQEQGMELSTKDWGWILSIFLGKGSFSNLNREQMLQKKIVANS